MYHSNVAQFANHNILEIIFNGFKGTKLLLRRCDFENITEANYKKMIGQEWKCYETLMHFELSKATHLKQCVLNLIVTNLSKAANLKVVKLTELFAFQDRF